MGLGTLFVVMSAHMGVFFPMGVLGLGMLVVGGAVTLKDSV